MIAQEGYTVIAVVAGGSLLLVLMAFQVEAWLWRAPLMAVAVGALAFALFFFRDPDRTPPSGAQDNAVLAPADGRVVETVEEQESTYLDGPAQRISIFLSPLDVHVNRVPARGVIEHAHYHPGDFLVAWHPKASEKNERSEFGVRHPSGTKILFKQIAGAVARRIVYHIGAGDAVRAGQRFGIVMFGSRMDVLVPVSVPLDVERGETVRAGETVLAHLPTSDAPKNSAPSGRSSAMVSDSSPS